MISIVMPVYNEGTQIYSNTVKIASILLKNNIEHQFILVDDGSNDNTKSEIKRLYKNYDNISVIELSRNFGKEAALCAALQNVSGDACVIIDSDLQHPPELIPKMVHLWKEDGYDIVEGVKSHRGKESVFQKIGAHIFYKIFIKTCKINLLSASDFKLLDRRVIESWKLMHESTTFFRGMSSWVGYNKIQIPFKVQERIKGTSKWSTTKLIKLAIRSITSYTSAPLYIVAWLGIIMMITDLILFIQTLYMKFNGKAFTGFTTVILLILGIGSCIMISLGIIGIYISKIYNEVKKRPRYIISNKYGEGFFYEK